MDEECCVIMLLELGKGGLWHAASRCNCKVSRQVAFSTSGKLKVRGSQGIKVKLLPRHPQVVAGAAKSDVTDDLKP